MVTSDMCIEIAEHEESVLVGYGLESINSFFREKLDVGQHAIVRSKG